MQTLLTVKRLTPPWLLALSAAAALAFPFLSGQAGEVVDGRKVVVLANDKARLTVDLGGGSIGDFRLKNSDLNPLHWATPAPGDSAIHGFGHFLCLDRWGPASEAEADQGMPYHGEAAHVEWNVLRESNREGATEAQLAAKLPKAGLSVRRTVRMSPSEAVFAVREEIKNENALGRIYNMVQHPSVGPPFLDESTVVDCNGRNGFAQGGSLPTPEEPSFFWPQGRTTDGEMVNMRRLTNDPNPNVVSYRLDTTYGWVTAATPGKQLLLGYVWLRKDYPWVSLWRDVRNGKPAARGLEFGTTGLHQPFSILVKKGRIWDTQLFEYLDAGETTAKSYLAFLAPIPADFGGVEFLEVDQGQLVLRERTAAKPRTIRVDARGLIPE